MKKRWKFIFKQVFANLRKNWLIIIGFSITLSLVAGMGFYVHEIEEYVVKEEHYNFDDIEITFNEYKENFQTDFNESGREIQDLISNTTLKIEEIVPYIYIDFNVIFNITPNIGETHPNFLISNQTYYDSTRFNNNFELISGEFPKNESSILIPIEFAKKYDLSVGENLKFQFNYGSYVHSSGEGGTGEFTGIHLAINITGFKISGFYGLKERDYFFMMGEPLDYLEGGHPHWMFFFFHDFSKNESIHPIFQSYNLLKKNPQITDIQIYFPIKHGYSIYLDRSWIDPNRLTAQINTINTEIFILKNNLPLGLTLTDYITSNLEHSIVRIQYYQLNLPFINIPIAIFTIFIGIFLISMNLKKRLEEILLLKIRGVPFEILRNQILAENLMNGVIAALLGTGLGIFSKNIFYNSITPLIFGRVNHENVFFTPNFSFDIIIQTIIFGIFIATIASFLALKSIKSLDTADILKRLGRADLEVEYDENTLFGMNYEEKRDIYSDFADFKSEEEENELYKNIIDLVEKKRVKRSLFFLLLAIIPVVYFVLKYWSISENAPDWLVNFKTLTNNVNNANNAPLSYLISLFFLISLIIAIIAFITEIPSRFAKITKKISSIWLKNKSYLAGIQILKEKKFSGLILIFSLIIGFLTLTNGYIYTQYRYSQLTHNFQVGTDLQITGAIKLESFQNHSDVIKLEEKLLMLSNENGQNLIKDVMFFYYSQPYLNRYYDESIEYCILNLSHYLSIIQSSQIILPDPQLIPDIQRIINYNKNPNNNRTAVIYTSDVRYPQGNYRNLVGRSFDAFVFYYINEMGEISGELLPVFAFNYVDVFPGIYKTRDVHSNRNFPIIDISDLEYTPNRTLADHLGFFIDFSEKIILNESYIEELLISEVSNSLSSVSVDFYNHNWDNFEFFFNLDGLGYLGLIYYSIYYIGLVFAFAFGVLLINFRRENSHIHSILRARGFSRKKIKRLMFSQIFVIFLIAFTVGLLTGMLSALISLKLGDSFVWNYENFSTLGFNIPIFFNIAEIFGLLTIISVISWLIFRVTTGIERKKSINIYLRQM
ncbi:MAG: FtsX-like permease family protein [Promethearchaeota archaeon]